MSNIKEIKELKSKIKVVGEESDEGEEQIKNEEEEVWKGSGNIVNNISESSAANTSINPGMMPEPRAREMPASRINEADFSMADEERRESSTTRDLYSAGGGNRASEGLYAARAAGETTVVERAEQQRGDGLIENEMRRNTGPTMSPMKTQETDGGWAQPTSSFRGERQLDRQGGFGQGGNEEKKYSIDERMERERKERRLPW